MRKFLLAAAVIIAPTFAAAQMNPAELKAQVDGMIADGTANLGQLRNNVLFMNQQVIDLGGKVISITKERDDLKTNLATVTKDRDDAKTSLEATQKDRDSTAKVRDDLQSQVNNLMQQVEILTKTSHPMAPRGMPTLGGEPTPKD